MTDSATLLWGVVFGAIGFAYLRYGHKRRLGVPFGCGVGLLLFPYFVSNTALLVAIGALLMAAPYFLRY
jgi:hypothetical protein